MLLTAILIFFLSTLLCLATDSYNIGTKSVKAFEEATQLFYLAEAGLAHGYAYCQAEGCAGELFFETSEEHLESFDSSSASPLYKWTSYGKGRYYLEVFDLKEIGLHPLLNRDSGILIVVTAYLDNIPSQKQLCLLIEAAPGWKKIAWWEPE